ncbi:hypothetical protein EVAR_53778_1 [Eumeta japonica]|uniref:Uncharacterized protein n=1 Tax=Eumeta variegata TaxID=151549 RepID=A0A4C1Z3Y6_EUMVA|nr:hypothetical protein EVAR_53778_1 [Eumeta japonica]
MAGGLDSQCGQFAYRDLSADNGTNAERIVRRIHMLQFKYPRHGVNRLFGRRGCGARASRKLERRAEHGAAQR